MNELNLDLLQQTTQSLLILGIDLILSILLHPTFAYLVLPALALGRTSATHLTQQKTLALALKFEV